jgi:WD40 repeat protein
VADLNGHEREVWSAAFSLDGKRLVTASDDNTARLWDTGEVDTGSLRLALDDKSSVHAGVPSVA